MVRMMRVGRVVVEARVTSFRYPFFVTGRQPTFDIPPPSTIFGHCASALGRWPDPQEFFFGIHFTYRARSRDLEHQHIASPLGPRTKTTVPSPSGEERATTEITVQPVERDFLFDTRMTLYLPEAVANAFRSPVYPVVLGRSQDLAEIVEVSNVELEPPRRVRLEHTLLPFRLRPCLRFGTTVLLTRYIGEPPVRNVVFERYISLHDPVFWGEGADPNQTLLAVDGISLDGLWSDPTIQDENGYSRGLWIHRLRD